MIGRGPGAAYAACCSVASRKLASELLFERAFYGGSLNSRATIDEGPCFATQPTPNKEAPSGIRSSTGLPRLGCSYRQVIIGRAVAC